MILGIIIVKKDNQPDKVNHNWDIHSFFWVFLYRLKYLPELDFGGLSERDKFNEDLFIIFNLDYSHILVFIFLTIHMPSNMLIYHNKLTILILHCFIVAVVSKVI